MKKSAYAHRSYNSDNTSYVIPVPIGNKVRSSDCTCLFSGAFVKAHLFSIENLRILSPDVLLLAE